MPDLFPFYQRADVVLTFRIQFKANELEQEDLAEYVPMCEETALAAPFVLVELDAPFQPRATWMRDLLEKAIRENVDGMMKNSATFVDVESKQEVVFNTPPMAP